MKKCSFTLIIACCTSLFLTALQPVAATASLKNPSWEEVESAKNQERKKQEAIVEVNVLLDDLESQTAAAGKQAIAENREYAKNQEALAESRLKLREREKQVSEADAKRAEAAGSVKKIVAQQYKIHGSLPVAAYGLFPSSLENSQDMAMEQYLLDRRQRTFDKHEQAHGVLKSLTDQQRSVKEEYEGLVRKVRDSRDSAVEAHQKAEEQVAEAKKRRFSLLEQLAALKNTSVERESAYRQEQQNRKAYQEQQEASRRHAPHDGFGQPAGGKNGAAGNPALPENTVPPHGNGESGQPPVVPPTPDNSPSAAKAFAKSALGSYGWGPEQFGCLLSLWERESNWRVDAMNAYSGAYGIPQALPGAKMASAGMDWRTSARTQIRWGLGYIKDRYGSPCAAWEHSQLVGWY